MHSLTLFNKKDGFSNGFSQQKGAKSNKKIRFLRRCLEIMPSQNKKNRFFLYSAHLFVPLSLLRNLEITPSQHKKE